MKTQVVGGVYLPEGEVHFVEMMMNNRKSSKIVEGKHTYQYHKLSASMSYIPKDRRRNCIDIGSHVGLWGMWLVKEFDHVHGFDPIKEFQEIWPLNVKGDNYTLYNYALGDDFGKVDLIVPYDQTGGTHVVHNQAGIDAALKAQEVMPPEKRGHFIAESIPMSPLDSFSIEDVDFIKIDVEGFELEIIKGAEETIKRDKPWMIIEQKGNDVKHYFGERDEAANLLKSWGMKDLRVISGDHIMGW